MSSSPLSRKARPNEVIPVLCDTDDGVRYISCEQPSSWPWKNDPWPGLAGHSTFLDVGLTNLDSTQQTFLHFTFGALVFLFWILSIPYRYKSLISYAVIRAVTRAFLRAPLLLVLLTRHLCDTDVFSGFTSCQLRIRGTLLLAERSILLVALHKSLTNDAIRRALSVVLWLTTSLTSITTSTFSLVLLIVYLLFLFCIVRWISLISSEQRSRPSPSSFPDKKKRNPHKHRPLYRYDPSVPRWVNFPLVVPQKPLVFPTLSFILTISWRLLFGGTLDQIAVDTIPPADAFCKPANCALKMFTSTHNPAEVMRMARALFASRWQKLASSQTKTTDKETTDKETTFPSKLSLSTKL